MKIKSIPLIIIAQILISVTHAQDCIQNIPDGYFIRTSPYYFEVSDTSKFLMTFNEVPMHKTHNTFVLRSIRNGTLKQFKIAGNDTVLISEKYIKFEDPPFRVTFVGLESGERIERTQLANKPIGVYKEGNDDVSYTIPILECYVHFQNKDNELEIKEVVNPIYDKNIIPEEIVNRTLDENLASEIAASGSTFFSLHIKIKFWDIERQLPPAIFYLD